MTPKEYQKGQGGGGLRLEKGRTGMAAFDLVFLGTGAADLAREAAGRCEI